VTICAGKAVVVVRQFGLDRSGVASQYFGKEVSSLEVNTRPQNCFRFNIARIINCLHRI